jgi:putative ABC transport system permease protein
VGKELALGVVTYAVVAFLHVRAIRKVPLALAMKAAE